MDKLTDDKFSLEREINAAKKLKITLQEEVETAKQNKLSIGGDITELELKRNELIEEVKSLNNEFDTLKSQKSRQLEEMNRKLQQITKDFLDAQKTEQISREDIAKRQLALDKREIVLQTRERKVEMSEQTIQNNSNLLNL